jgi:hypothetical protein
MQESQDFKFVVQTLTTTNVIPYENIQSQTLKNTNSFSKRKNLDNFYHLDPQPLKRKLINNEEKRFSKT